jgi:methylphosphotriester-DNA--protein-cysteine methyltransferase
MANNIFEQFVEAYSRWSILDKVGKEMQLERLWQRTSAAYNYLFQVYQNRGYLTPQEANYANQISQMLKALQSQKMKVDRDLSNEMMNHLVKMIVKQ